MNSRYTEVELLAITKTEKTIDYTTGEVFENYEVVHRTKGSKKVASMCEWFDKSPYRKVRIAVEYDEYKNFSSFRSTVTSYVDLTRDKFKNYIIVSVYHKELFLEKI